MSDITLNSLFEKVGGRYVLAALVQQRISAIMKGAPALASGEGLDTYQTVLLEVEQSKVELAMPDKKKEHVAP